jgi:hypothetical protein
MRWALLGLSVLGCKASPPANPAFDDAAKYAFTQIEGEEVDLAYAIRVLEDQVYRGLDVSANNVLDRAVELSHLTEADVVGLERPDRDLADAIPTAVAGLSPYEPTLHQHIQMLTDHTPVEPYSPDHYDRAFVEGEDCWIDQGCTWLKTENDLTKVNALMSIPYRFNKWFRWVDLNLPDPADVPNGEEPVNDGAPRWAFVSRSWTTEEYYGEGGNTGILQSFTMELWIPRDGGGFRWEDTTRTETDGDWETDSDGDGTLRVLALWAETDVGFDAGENVIVATTRTGIDDNFKAADDWIEDVWLAPEE